MPNTSQKQPSDSASGHAHSSATDNGPTKKTVLEGHGYIIGHTIGTGTYAIVKEIGVLKVAWSITHNCNVAIKIVSKFTAPSDYLKKFLPREIEVVKGLKHPNLIRFLQAIETTHRVYIIMEYAENGSLLDLIRQETFLDETRSKKWFRELIDAVNYCHERNIVHRDIKCENMLMDTKFNLKLSDFGFARGQLRTPGGQIVFSETFCGSYAYASPEILKGIPYQPHMSDVWSCGVVLYAMVFGRLPFDDSNFTTLLKQVTTKVNFPREPRVSLSCKSLINRILAPLKQRATIQAILKDEWCTDAAIPSDPSNMQPETAMASTTKAELKKENPAKSLDKNIPNKLSGPAKSSV